MPYGLPPTRRQPRTVLVQVLVVLARVLGEVVAVAVSVRRPRAGALRVTAHRVWALRGQSLTVPSALMLYSSL